MTKTDFSDNANYNKSESNLPPPDHTFLLLRSRAGLTQVELGRLIGLSHRMVLNWEAGSNLPRPEALRKLLEVYLAREVFTRDSESEEAQQLWDAVKKLFEQRTSTNTLYPSFDQAWFKQLLKAKNSKPIPPTSSETPERKKHNLTFQLSSFVGRQVAKQKIKELLVNARLLTITGTGGVGKTRLAQQVGNEALDQFKEGVWFIDLAPLREELALVEAIAQIVDLQTFASDNLPAALQAHLKDKSLLLILDNCEHLVESCARLVDSLLRACPHLTILATSREALSVEGEIIWNLQPLATPSELHLPQKLSGFEAVELFVERASRIKSDFKLTEQNSLAVIQICQQLDGLPLALELAARQVNVLPVEEIADQLRNRLGARFSLLIGGNRSTQTRQQTLMALIDWSYNLISQKEQLLLCKLAIFSSGCHLGAIETICTSDEISESEILEVLLQLLNKSLVVAEEYSTNLTTPSPRVVKVRYRLLETIREYALVKINERGAELEKLKQKHASYYLALTTPTQQAWRTHLAEGDRDNLRVALEWALAGGIGTLNLTEELQLGLLIKLTQIQEMVNPYLINQKLWQQLLELTEKIGDEYQAVRALNKIGQWHWQQQDYHYALIFFGRALEIARLVNYVPGIIAALNNTGNIFVVLQKYEKALVSYFRALQLHAQSHDPNTIAYTLNCLGGLFYQLGKFDQAANCFFAALPYYETSSKKAELAQNFNNLGAVYFAQDNFTEANRFHRQALELKEALDDKTGQAISLHNLVLTLAKAGNNAEADRLRQRLRQLLPELDSNFARIFV